MFFYAAPDGFMSVWFVRRGHDTMEEGRGRAGEGGGEGV